MVSQYLREEVELGRVLGPFSIAEAMVASWHISKFGVIPKSHQPNKWRLIVDLSQPDGASVNGGIDTNLCSLSYTKVDEVICRLGKKPRTG